MTERELLGLILGRSRARVEAGWTQGAYSRHSDGRALTRGFGTAAHSNAVDVVGALYQSSQEYGISDRSFETLRLLVTAHLPSPFNSDEDFGAERWNDLVSTRKIHVVTVLYITQKDYEWADVLSAFPSALIAA